MLRRLAAATTASLLLAGGLLPAAAPPPHPALARGLALMREGDFEAAVLELDAAVRKIESDPAAERHRAWAYVYLGVAYLELEQETVARGKFREALARDRGLRLEPADFSAQSIRVFEGVRAEAASAVAAAPLPAPVAPQPSPGASATPAREKKSSKGPLVAVLLGGAAAAGAAVALGGGGGNAGTTSTTAPIGGGTTMVPGPSPSPSEPPPTTVPGAPTTTTPGPAPTTTQPPATTLPPACTYTVNGPTPPNPYPQTGLIGTCSVQTQAGCRWTAESNRPWVHASGSASGSGTIQFTLDPNPDAGTRSGSILLAERPSASCPIQQRGLLSLHETTEPGAADSISELDVEGAAGQVVVDGSSVSYHVRGTVTVAIRGGTRVHRVEATLVAAAGRPGTWRFHLPSGVKPGSLRVVAGDVAAITADTVTFRLAGRPGERIVFRFSCC